MMIIDFHCHIGKSDKRLSFREIKEITPQEILIMQRRTGIDYSVALPMPKIRPEDLAETNAIMGILKEETILPFVWLNPLFLRAYDPRGTAEDLLIERIMEGRVYGIKVHPVIDGYYPDPKLMTPIFEIAHTCDLPILWHTGWGALGDPLFIELTAKLFPDVKIIIGHMIEPDAPFVALRCENVMIETSYCSGPQRLAGIVHLLGSEKVLFGSDFPVNSTTIQKMIIEEADISDTDKENILGLNAKRILKL